MINLAETYLLLNVATQAAFKTNPVTFLTSKGLSGSYAITLRELIEGGGRFYNDPATSAFEGRTHYIMKNLKKNGLSAAMQMILIPICFRFGKNLARPVISRTNRLLGKAKVANTVKL